MARIARVMHEGWPFHLTHRGNHRKPVFRRDADCRTYLSLLDRFSRQFGMKIWAYCLMPNHIHLLAVGTRRTSIARALGNAQGTFSRMRNRETGVTGHLWANRFFSSALDRPHLWAAVRYIELNPVRGGLVDQALAYRWSSARAHAGLVRDPLLDRQSPFPGPIGDWTSWLGIGLDAETVKRLRSNTTAGRPSGDEDFVRELEDRLQRRLGRGSRRSEASDTR
jgi:putative transposase